MLREGFDGCFGGVVSCVAWRVGDALFAASYDHAAGGFGRRDE